MLRFALKQRVSNDILVFWSSDYTEWHFNYFLFAIFSCSCWFFRLNWIFLKWFCWNFWFCLNWSINDQWNFPKTRRNRSFSVVLMIVFSITKTIFWNSLQLSLFVFCFCANILFSIPPGIWFARRLLPLWFDLCQCLCLIDSRCVVNTLYVGTRLCGILLLLPAEKFHLNQGIYICLWENEIRDAKLRLM